MKILNKLSRMVPGGIVCLAVIALLFGYLASVMGTANMLNTIMKTAHDLLLNTVFYLMAICVITGALGKIFVEFGVVKLLEKLLRPLMKPLFNLPGVASLGAVMTFLSDNPAVISLAKDKRFATYFKKFQLISLTNFGTAFGMGLLVIVFMVGQGYFIEPLVGLLGAIAGCIVSTRLMQRFVIKAYPKFKEENAMELEKEETKIDDGYKKPLFQRILDSLLDGGRSGVDVGLAIIPGVLIISTLVMLLTFSAGENGFTGDAYQGVELLPWIGEKLNLVFEALFGFNDPHLIAFPITALGAVGAALGLVPNFAAEGWIDGNAIAVFTAIGMCWSGYLSTHTAMLDALGYRKLTSKAILAHTVGGFVAGIVAHFVYLVISLLFFSPVPVENITKLEDGKDVVLEWNSGEYVWQSADSTGMSMMDFKISVPEKGALTIVFADSVADVSLETCGIALMDCDGHTVVSHYHMGETNAGTGVHYTLENIPEGVYPLRSYVLGCDEIKNIKGTTTLRFESDRLVEVRKLKGLCVVVESELKSNTAEYGMVELLKGVYDNACKLAENNKATVAQLKAAYKELDDVYAIYLKEKSRSRVTAGDAASAEQL